MARTPSNMIALGTALPAFNLPDTVSGKNISDEDLKGAKASGIMFICNHCPFVKHVNKELVRLANDYIPKGIKFIAISSNDVVNYPEDAPDKMKETAKQLGYPFPYLYDETQQIAKAYSAACTPDFYILDKNLQIVYRGRFDDSTPSNGKPVTGIELSQALDHLIAGNAPPQNQKPSIGCNIKWKK